MPSIQITYPALTLKAGSRALQRIRTQGLNPAHVGILPGAAGGPRALGIQGLDLALFGDWLPLASRPRALIGASIGSWRFACACRTDPVKALRQLGECYINMRFSKKADRSEISSESAQMLRELLIGEEHRIVENPNYHLNVLMVKCLGKLASDDPKTLKWALAAALCDNLLDRRRLGRHVERVIAHDARYPPPLSALTDVTSRFVPLRADNLHAVLMASASIPMVMNGVSDLPGASEGVFRDGGILDYHLDLPYEGDDLVLYPHFSDRIIPGWFDKPLPWRQKGNAQRLQNVLLLTPSREYLERLPHGKLPDRTDYKRYLGDDAGRERYWRQAIDESRRLGDAFLELAEKQQFSQLVTPLFRER